MTDFKHNGLTLESRFRRIRLLMWILLIILHLVTSFHRVSFNVLADSLTAEFSLTGVALGNLAAAYTYMYVLMQIPGGILVDRLGPRYIALLTGLAMAIGSILIGLAPAGSTIFLGRMLIGFGGSVVLINIFKFQASWYRQSEFATMSGFALLVSTAGALMAASPLAYTASLYGWRSPFIIFGIITVLVTLLCLLIVRDHPIELYGSSISLPGITAADEKAVPFNLKVLKTVLSNRRILGPFLINFGTYGGFIVFAGTWGVSYLVHVYGIDIGQASVYMTFAYIGYMIGAPSAGLLSARLQSLKIPTLILVGSAVIFWLLLLTWPSGQIPLWMFYFISLLIGFGGASTVLSFPMARVVSISGHTGLITATVNLGVFLGMAVLQPLFGLLLDKGWTGLILNGARIYPPEAYRLGFLVAFIFALVSLFATISYREKKPETSGQ